MTSILLQARDSLSVSEGHQAIADQINVLSIIVGLSVVLGFIFIVRYIIKEKAKKK